MKNIGEPKYKERENKNKKILTILYVENDKQLFVNESLYFADVEKKIWEYKIGGYQVLEKYLENHKNEEIDFNHFQNIVQILSETLEIENKIAAIDIF